MKLVDLLEVIDESTDVIVCNIGGDVIATYGCTDSIDKQYNDFEVIRVSAEEDALVIIINAEV